MAWKAIVAGVDPSAEGVRAAVTAARLAEATGAACYLVHGVADPWTGASIAQIPMDLKELNRLVLDSARARLLEVLEGKVPGAVLDRMDVRFGPPAIVLREAADQVDAELLVLGGKHHSAVGRWLAGSTAHHVVRLADLPILVTGSSEAPIRRVLAAVDLSGAARPTLDAAERLADLVRAELRVLHVVEPVPLLANLPMRFEEAELVRRAEEELERTVWPLVGRPDAERLVLFGSPAATIAAAAAEWRADLVVVGSHGKGWVDRILIGSSTERLLNTLPAALLVVPVVSGPRRPPSERRRAAAPPARRPRAGK